MKEEYCRVSIDERNYQAGLYDCECQMAQLRSKAQGNPYWAETKCDACICNDTDYFEEIE